MATKHEVPTVVYVTAPNGVTWRRREGATSTGPELLRALHDLLEVHTIARRWNWWEEGRQQREEGALIRIVREWDNGAPKVTKEEAETRAKAMMEELDREHEAEKQRRADLVAESYDEDRGALRLKLLRTESDAAFFARVLGAPASPAQRDDAERRADESRAAADEMRRELGDPEQVIDRKGFLPAERRELNLSSHVDYWRHPCLREWATTDRRRFNALLKMPMPDPDATCTECQAPTEWHDYDLSLRLFQSRPPAGSQAETLTRLMPGWWERCPACTTYNIHHQWGGSHALPDFTGDQWIAMLPPHLREIFVKPDKQPKSKRSKKTKARPLAVVPPGSISEVMARLAKAQAKHPTADVRQGAGGRWELWPSSTDAAPGSTTPSTTRN